MFAVYVCLYTCSYKMPFGSENLDMCLSAFFVYPSFICTYVCMCVKETYSHSMTIATQ